MEEITINQKIEFIKKALEMGVTQIKICPQAKGEALRRLLKSSNRVGEKKIDDMYKNARYHLGETEFLPPKKEFIPNKNDNLAYVVREQEKRIKKLEEEICQIKKLLLQKNENIAIESEIENTENEVKNVRTGVKSIFNFSIIRNTSTSKRCGKKYKYFIYYAIKTIEGKQVKIYIGKDTSNAEEKIKSYCQKHNINLQD